MSFGGLFGAWFFATALLASKKGWLVVGYSVAGYSTLWIAVAMIGWFLEDRSATKKD